MRKAEALDILTKYQAYRFGRYHTLNHAGITPVSIGQALDVAIETLELNTLLGDVKECRTNKKYAGKSRV